MGVLRTALALGLTGAAGGVAAAGAGCAYLASNTQLFNLGRDDAMFRSNAYARYNPRGNPALHDDCVKRVPLGRVRPELRDDEAALTLAFCRGVWSRWGFWPQSKLQERYDKPPGTDDNLWDVKDLAVSKFEKGLRFSNHFEVVEHRGNEIVVRCGGSPMNAGLRDSDGLVFLSARIDKEALQAEFSLKSALFSSAAPHVEGAPHPIPPKITILHRWYVRMLVQSAVGNVTA
ncbi:hypothetical protein GGR56DRAFT_671229 [Xylariaceae sp. FL0804]|nr:hypothetical protein GGR56DRAFT_671229 [Xylariaceae sp. FL0804]